jgi:dTDP-glucose 4,6-dehydratase
MRALITGGAGFLGSHLTDLLVSRDWEVVVIDNCVTGDAENLSHYGPNDSVQLLELDACEEYEVGPVDFVFHFASPASPVDFPRIPIEVLRINSVGAQVALEYARRHGAKFMVASTSEVYGDPLESPQKETYRGNVSTIGVRSCYDEGKRFGEAMTMAYRRAHGLDTRIVRFFNTYGPRMRANDGRVIPTLISQALKNEPMTVQGNGMQTRSMGYVGDVVEGIYKLAMIGFQEPVNIGNNVEQTILSVAEAVRTACGSSSEIVFTPANEDDPQRRQPDLTRANEILGWHPTTKLEDGLKPTVDYFRGRL